MEKALRKQLIEEAKNKKSVMGVLSLKNTLTGKQYIEGSLNTDALVNRIRFSLKNGLLKNEALQKDWQELGESCFVFEVVHIVKRDEKLYTNYSKEIQKATTAVIAQQIISNGLLYNEL
ncbi:hypothetical protein SAMN05421788_11488 [Filimonas lacunae]|uniref:LuxR family transcriptional regulator n=1 Tax=Filimonas lacunae TaxID=477680 RepID=A0A173MLK6_9BACT|nr:GIY-YIG nuclease family protein [Filimonas lacunae]BAV08504.1 transcriptional regulator, ArsR family [Filimonas lacunae]SIT34032.1 hypothetical protein SAMN05421788_11488 [Filimonas lacunae]